MKHGPGGVIAACFALSAFLVAIMAGLAAGHPAVTVLVRACGAMILCYPAGLIVGMLCQRVLSWHADDSKADDQPATALSEEPATTEESMTAADSSDAGDEAAVAA